MQHSNVSCINAAMRVEQTDYRFDADYQSPEPVRPSTPWNYWPRPTHSDPFNQNVAILKGTEALQPPDNFGILNVFISFRFIQHFSSHSVSHSNVNHFNLNKFLVDAIPLNRDRREFNRASHSHASLASLSCIELCSFCFVRTIPSRRCSSSITARFARQGNPCDSLVRPLSHVIC